MMDLNELLSQLQSTQQTKATSRLSERNVIDLVNKLKQLGILGDELLYTINGKEYITTEELKKEVGLALKQSGGRLALVELPALVGCDLLHCERQAAVVVAEGEGKVLEAQGELITVQYFDAIVGEINDLLQESGQISLADLAVQYALNTELLASMLHSRMGSTIQGRLEAGLLYTSAYLRNIKAVLRGALRGVSEPTTMTSVIKELGLESAALGGSGGGSVVASIVDELVKEGALAGSLKGGGVNWVPAVYSTAQHSAVRNFYEQNGWVGYDTAKRMGIPNASSYLRAAFPDGIPLETALVGPSLLSQLEGAIEEPIAAAASSCWADISLLLPSILTPGDTAALLSCLPQLCAATAAAAAKRPHHNHHASPVLIPRAGLPTSTSAHNSSCNVGRSGGSGTGAGVVGCAHVLAGTCVASGALVDELEAELCARARQRAEAALLERRRTSSAAASTSSPAAQPVANKSKGGSGAEKGQQAGRSSEDEDWAANAKRGGRGGKGGKSSGKAGKKGGGGGGAKAGSKGHSAHGGAFSLTTADLEAQVLELRPDLEGVGTTGSCTAGEASGGAAEALAALLLPAAAEAYEATLSAAFTTSAEEKRRAKEALAQALDAAYQRLCLYAVGVEEFAPSPAESSPGGGGGQDREAGGDDPGAKPAKASGKKGAAAAAEKAASAKERRADKPQPAGDAQADGSSSSSAQPGTQQQQQQQQQKGGGDKAAEAVYTALVRHALRTTGAEAVDALCKWAHVEHEAGAMSDSNTKAAGTAAAAQGGNSRVMDLVKSPPLSPAERGMLLRALPSDAAAALAAALEAIGSASTIRDALEALSHAAEVLGLRLKAVDKKAERAVLAQLRAELLGALCSEHDPAAALALVVPLLYMRATGKAVSIPGKALAAVLARCGSRSSSSSGARASAGGLNPEALASVEAFHAQVVEHLVLMGGGGGGGTDAEARRASLTESLAQQLPAMKCLAGLDR